MTLSVDKEFNPSEPTFTGARPPRSGKSALARMQQHAVFEQKIREAELEVALQAFVRDAVLSFKASRR